jgi:hypothetical protein
MPIRLVCLDHANGIRFHGSPARGAPQVQTWDRVRFHHERSVSAAHGAYLVTMQLPERDGGFEDRIRSPDGPHERIARESELREA